MKYEGYINTLISVTLVAQTCLLWFILFLYSKNYTRKCVCCIHTVKNQQKYSNKKSIHMLCRPVFPKQVQLKPTSLNNPING